MIYQNQSLRIIFTVTDESGNIIDLSTYSSVNLDIKKPSNSRSVVAGNLLTDGTDGKVYHDFLVDELDELGVWYSQVILIDALNDSPSTIINFSVIDRLN